MKARRNFAVFYIFECRKERTDGTGARCGWQVRVGEGRVSRVRDGNRTREILDFCKRCRRQGRVQDGERCTFYFLRRETKSRRALEDITLIPFGEFLTGNC